MSLLNVGFIGFGQQAAKQHAWHIVDQWLGKVKIVAISDILPTDVQTVESHLDNLGLKNVAIYTSEIEGQLSASDTSSVEKLYKNHPELNAVIISTPNVKHYYQIKACLERKLHVLVDKPLALTYIQGRELVSLTNSKESPFLVVSSQRRYESVYQYAKRVLSKGELGDVSTINSVISHSVDQIYGWRKNPDLAGGGALWHFGWHTVDTILYLMNKKVLAVDAMVHDVEGSVIDTYANALILFEGNSSVSLSINCVAPINSVYERLQMWGNRGMLVLDRFKPIYDDRPPVVTHQLYNGHVMETNFSNAKAQKWAPTEAFIKLLTCTPDERNQARASVLSSGADSLGTVQLIEALYTSSSMQKRIYLTE